MLHDNLLALSTSRVEDVLPLLEGDGAPDLLIVDSVQTFTSESAEGLPGNVSQVRAVATEIVDACKRGTTTVVLVGHVTKDGALAGPRLLEHMVDTVISLEGDRRQMFRLLRVLKNRFGPNQELLVFQMVRQGLEVVEDPATYFLGARDASLSGTAVVMAVDGKGRWPWKCRRWSRAATCRSPGARGWDLTSTDCILSWLYWKNACA